jgi:hypothetical protein
MVVLHCDLGHSDPSPWVRRAGRIGSLAGGATVSDRLAALVYLSTQRRTEMRRASPLPPPAREPPLIVTGLGDYEASV